MVAYKVAPIANLIAIIAIFIAIIAILIAIVAIVLLMSAKRYYEVFGSRKYASQYAERLVLVCFWFFNIWFFNIWFSVDLHQVVTKHKEVVTTFDHLLCLVVK